MNMNREIESNNGANEGRDRIRALIGPVRGNFVSRDRQAARLRERRKSELIRVRLRDIELEIFRGVYDTGVDTELMIDSVAISSNETFLEVGCGSGAVAIFLARNAQYGIGVDINQTAVRNSQRNAARLGVSNVIFLRSNVFEAVHTRFEVLVCNPPYSCNPASDVIDNMFWDPANRMKEKLFSGADARLTERGRIYFGWADFDGLDKDLPIKLAEKHGFALRNTYERRCNSGAYRFLVLEFHRLHLK
jgi:predicted RNA methylase